MRHTVKKWTYSDLVVNLDLVERNLRRNNAKFVPEPKEIRNKKVINQASREGADLDDHDPKEEVIELDWLAESASFLSNSPKRNPSLPPVYDIILTVDTLYNPSLSLPLAHTIISMANPETIVLIVVELREPEAIEIFLTEMISRGWCAVRVGGEGSGRQDEGKAWIGWVCWMS